jgi:predicted Rossmann fold nucleotide-binding protein DprA/Smf involved in DNA uptake
MFLDDIKPAQRALRTDPSTSKAAARNAEQFAASHAGRILAALKEGPRTAHGLAAMTGLTVEQCCRRLPELQSKNLAQPMTAEDGSEVTVGGFRVWRKV